MRIIGGEWRGRRLEVPQDIRPMQDRERERLFSILGPHLEDAAFLEVFAGSGAISLEALSRGARLATLVENGRKVLPILRRNLESLDGGERSRLLPISAFGLPKSGEPGAGTVDIASAAPPFPLLEDRALTKRFHTLFGYIHGQLVVPGGLFALEHPSRLDPAQATGLGAPRTTRKTGASSVSIWDRAG